MASSNTATAHPANGGFAYEAEEVEDEASPWEYADASDEEYYERPNRGFVIKSSWKVRITAAMLWIMLFIAASGGIYAFFRATPAPTPEIPPAVDVNGPSGFGQAFVTTYLQTYADNSEQVKQFYPDNSFAAKVKVPQFRVWHTFVAKTETIQPLYWSVTVAADLSVNTSTDIKNLNFVKIPELRYYRVSIQRGVDKDGFGTYVATSLPSLVPAIPVGNVPDTLVGAATSVSDGQNTALKQFFDAWLVGAGDLRFVRTDNNDSHLRPFDKPPFEAGSIEIGDSFTRFTDTPLGKQQNEAYVTTSVTATDAYGVAQVFNYTLVMKFGDGKWLVDDVERAAPLAPVVDNAQK